MAGKGRPLLSAWLHSVERTGIAFNRLYVGDGSETDPAYAAVWDDWFFDEDSAGATNIRAIAYHHRHHNLAG